jgi:hypothetical protein
MKYQLICMSFDGEYQRERPEFDTIEKAWEYENDLGSKWYFYPFHFVVSKETIRSSPWPLDFLEGKRIKTASNLFEAHSNNPENEGMDAEEFALSINYS